MAAIDSILRILVLRDAEAMILTSGQVPSLRRGGNVERMSMPALDAGMVAGFVEELAPSGGADLAARGSLDVAYTSADGARFSVLIEKVGGGYRLIARRATAAGPAKLGSPPVVALAPPVPVPALVSVPVSVSEAVSAAVTGVLEPSRQLSPRLSSLVAHAVAARATDVLLSSGAPPRLRVDGELVAAAEDDDHPVDAAEILSLLDESDRQALAARGSADFAVEGPAGRMRVNAFRHHGGVGAALRLVRTDVPSAQDLRLPEDIADAVKPANGLVLVCGPAGAGKSTTLVALVEHLNRTRARHIVTLEDPIEYRYTPRRCLVHQREIGVHAPTFADGLRAALRESPDVIVVGELRDREAIAIAMTAAETGHLVLGTLHAPSAAVAMDRIIDVFPEHQQRQVRLQLASVLRVVITQVLVSTRGGGRAPAIERCIVTPAVAHLIRKSELQMLGSLIQSGRDIGMIPLERSLARLVQDRAVDAAVARAAAPETDLFDQLVRSRSID